MMGLLSRAARALLRGVMHVERWVRACVRNGCIIDRLSLPAFVKCFMLIVARCPRVQECCGWFNTGSLHVHPA